ncbi:MAG TPA: tetratricopeptide repeat protein [Anaerolineales bacterium]|nr:tetratricopeptide repeat protein [Anaerolineales bacterium]
MVQIGGGISLPTGTVTFLFTDIEGSSKIAQEYPDQWETLRARHNLILQSVMETYEGFVFQIIGDAFCVAFHSASHALHAALDAQRLLQGESWSPASIKVRMGIHTGAAQLNHHSDQIKYVGYTTLVATQRITSAGHGGQVLISGATQELVRDVLPAEIELIDLGERRLKDLLRPEHLYQLQAPGLASTFRPLKTLDAYRSNLPVQLTSFIGREQEIAQIKQALKNHHLVTLTGPGGTGKTRLSLRVAAELLNQFPHGVWFIELAPLTNPDLIPQTILSAIGISEQSGEPLKVLRDYLREKKSLIVLDNCEHLLEASAIVANTLLTSAPDLKVLASSREALGVPGELSYTVPSLSLPDIKQLPAIELLSGYEAIQLFIDRASLVAPHFAVDNDNAWSIAQICYRLDGIPLAIELAAARVQMLSVEQISGRLDDRFRLLTGGARVLLPRQQTLRALIDWSYDLLSEQERLFFRRLSVFAGGWTLEAAEEVCADADPDAVLSGKAESKDDIHPYDVLHLLTQLVNKSLVLAIEGSQSGETRYRMLETIRQYARDRLLEAGGSEILRQRHLDYFVKLTAQAGPELYRSNQAFWLNSLDEELDNLRTALEWALETHVESGLRMVAGPVYRFWLFRSTSRELGNWLAQLLEQYDKPNPLCVRALAIQSHCIGNTEGNFHEAHRLAEKSLQMARSLRDRPSEAFSLSILGGFTLLQGNLGEAIPLLEQSLAIYRELGDKVGQAGAIDWLSINNSDLERATAYAKEGLGLCRELGDLTGVASILTTLARLTYSRGDFSSPGPWLDEVLFIARQLGDQVREDEALITYGTLAYWQGDYPRARAFYEEGISLGEKIGYHYQNLWAQIYMAYAILRMGELQNSRQLFEDGIRGMQKADLVIGLVFAVEGLASLHVTQSQPERAARLFAWATAMRAKMGDPRPPVEQASVERDLEVIRSQLSDSEFSRLSTEGLSLTIEEAVALALQETHE